MNRVGQFFRNVYLLFTKDLSREEFERLFSSETRGMYEFYNRSVPSLEGEKNKFIRAVKLAWHLFIAFLTRLSPARRILYAMALLLVLTSRNRVDNTDALYAFLILTFLLALEMAERLTTRDELEVA
ncbi:MAG: hypothetical protein HY966_03530, partial [Ignavibacteriales bacterium]|nr:hypothetical protein [Ignavibacteriales bacterium]